MDWLRLYTEVIDDPKMAKLSEKSFKIFIFLMCFAQELDENGVINRSLADISWRLRTPEKDIKKAISDLVALDIISSENDVSFLNWSKRQYKSDNAGERKRQQRERNKNTVSRDVSRDVSQPPNVTSPVPEQSRAEQRQSRVKTVTQVVTSPPEPEPDLEPEKEKPKIAFEDLEEKTEGLTELQKLVAQVKTKFPKFPVETWYGKNRSRHPEAITHVLRSLLRAKTIEASEMAYIQKALDVEDGKYNARDFDVKQAVMKRPIPGEMERAGGILQRLATANTG